jgi:hypothetical protein
MTNNKIIAAADRTASPRGAKMLVVGPTGVGKTSLLRTLDLSSTLFVDVEAGDLSVADLSVDTFRPRTWSECRDVACILTGPNPAVPADACYSEGHYNAAVAALGNPKQYSTFFIDSLTAVGRLCFQWASQQPEAFSDRSGKRDLRGAYGLHARQMLGWLLHLQQARTVNVCFLGILETIVDDYGRTEHRLQHEGARTSRELPGVIDEVITYNWTNFGDGTLTRSFVCTTPNQWGYPAKDRSGRLEQFEPPHLGKLFSKLSAKSASGDVVELETAQQQKG